jgi:hypothetical protein
MRFWYAMPVSITAISKMDSTPRLILAEAQYDMINSVEFDSIAEQVENST